MVRRLILPTKRELISGAVAVAIYDSLGRPANAWPRKGGGYTGPPPPPPPPPPGCAAGGTWDATATTFFNRIPSQACLTTAQQTAYNQFIVDGKNDGWFQKLDCCVVLAGPNSVVSLMDLTNQHDFTAVGTVAFTAFAGWQGPGSANGYLNTGLNPATNLTNFTQNAASIGVFVSQAPTIGTYLAGGTTTIVAGDNNGNIGAAINDNGFDSLGGHCPPLEHVIISRPENVNANRYVSGMNASLHTATSVAPTNEVWKVCGAGNTFSNARIALFHCGQNMNALDMINIRARFIKLMNALGATFQNNIFQANPGQNANVGRIMYPDANVYTTQNAGQTWSYKRDGPHHRFELRQGDFDPSVDPSGSGRYRTELLSQTNWPQFEEYWWAYSFWLEPGGGAVQGNTICGQFHNVTSTGSPPYAVTQSWGNVDAMDFFIQPSQGVVPSNVNINRGALYNFVHQLYFDPNGTTGYQNCWMNGTLIMSKSNIKFGYADVGNGQYMKFGTYRAWSTDLPDTVINHYWNMEVRTGVNALQQRIATPLPCWGGPIGY